MADKASLKNVMGRDQHERIELLRQEVALKNAKLQALEDGTWPWIETEEVRRRPVTPARLAEAFGLTVQAAGNRLKRLVDVGLMTRERATGSRQHVYHSVLWLDGASAERAAEILRRRRDYHGFGLHDRLWAALAGYEAQYGKDSIGEAHPELPPGCIERIDSLVAAARDLVAWSHPHGSWS